MIAKKLLVLGASGRTGQHVVTQALQRGHTVTAFVRDPAKLAITSDRLITVTGNTTTDDAALGDAARGQDAVISTIGVGESFKSLDLISQSMPRIIRAMEAQGVSRLIFTSAFGVNETFRDVPLVPRIFMRTLLRDVYRDKAAAEAELNLSRLEWTLVHPAGLTSGPATGQYRKGERLKLKGFPTIARTDVADFLVAQIDDTTFIRKTVLVSY